MNVKKFFPLFSSRNFIVSVLTCKSLTDSLFIYLFFIFKLINSFFYYNTSLFRKKHLCLEMVTNGNGNTERKEQHIF